MSGGNKPRVSLLSPDFILGTAAALTFGADKHGCREYRDEHLLDEYYDKAQRHLWKFWQGEDNDESGLSHLYHAAADIDIMIDILKRTPERDNRPHKTAATTETLQQRLGNRGLLGEPIERT